MTADVNRYIARGYRQVGGWIRPDALRVTRAIDAVQQREGVRGNVAEVGVHHGQYYILLDLLRQDGEHGLVIDIFEDQHLNVDGSGRGDRQVFESNLARHSRGLTDVCVLQADSTSLSPEDLTAAANGRFRLFSVDGGHTARCAANDLTLAAATLVDGGVVALDDYYNERWPGVVEGAARFFLEEERDIIPVAIGFSKLFCSTRQIAPAIRAELQRLATRRLWHFASSELYGSEVIVLQKFGWRRRVRRGAVPVLQILRSRG